MEKVSNSIDLQARLDVGFDRAVERVTEALKAEGFGVLTEIDVQATMKQKLEVEFRPYKILGACNPPLAHRALTAAPEAGLLLPCNVVVAQADDGTVEVNIVDPLSLLGFLRQPALEPIAGEARARLERVIAALRG